MVICEWNPPSSSHQMVRNAILESDEYSFSETDKYTYPNTKKYQIHHPKYHLRQELGVIIAPNREFFIRRVGFCWLAGEPSFVGKSKFQDRKQTKNLFIEYLNYDVC